MLKVGEEKEKGMHRQQDVQAGSVCKKQPMHAMLSTTHHPRGERGK